MIDTTRGFSLVETLVAMFLLLLLVTGVAPMFVNASRQTAAGADMGLVGAAAVDRLEQLRAAPYRSLNAGGSLTADTTVGGVSYFDASDPDYLVRWQIVDNATPVGCKQITVRALALRQVAGLPKEAVLTTLRAGR